jgi:hypothetical protein
MKLPLMRCHLLIAMLLALDLTLASGCGPVAVGNAPNDKAAVPPETAVYYAAKYARMSSPGPGPQIVGEPAEIRGKVMPREESERYRPAGQRYWGSQEERELSVWLVAIRGDFQVPGGSSLTYRQGIFVLDAHTAQAIGSSHFPAGRDVDTSSLPVLALPASPVPTLFAANTPAPAPTPVPTKPAAPPPPSPIPSASRASTYDNPPESVSGGTDAGRTGRGSGS